MSLSIERVLNEINQLSLVEQMQVLEHLVKQIKQSVETIHLLKSPANAAHLERSIAQFKQGKI